MHPRIYQEYERVLHQLPLQGRVLEIGAAGRTGDLLRMPVIKERATERLGINLEGPVKCDGYVVEEGNANSMPQMHDNTFDVVLCNAVLEHDPYFWKTISEIRRVTKPGGLVVLGVPGFREYPGEKRWLKAMRRVPKLYRHANALVSSTITFRVHNAPGDYWRFSEQACREVLMEGFRDVEFRAVMLPPRMICTGFKI